MRVGEGGTVGAGRFQQRDLETSIVGKQDQIRPLKRGTLPWMGGNDDDWHKSFAKLKELWCESLSRRYFCTKATAPPVLPKNPIFFDQSTPFEERNKSVKAFFEIRKTDRVTNLVGHQIGQ